MGLSEDLKKILICQKAKACEQGQAVLEYILVLIVVVSIVLGILYQFNDAFRNFLQSYFGNYLTCLLETGELPALGGEGDPNQGICSARFKNFNVANGRSIVDPNTNRAAAENSRTSTNDENKNGSGGGSGGGGNQTSSSRKNSSSSRPGRFNKTNAPANAEAKLSDRPARQRLQMDQNSQGDEDTNEGDTFKSGRTGSRRRIVRRRVMRLDEEYLTEKEKEKKEKTVGDDKKIIADGGPVSNLRKARFDLKLPEPPKPTVEDKGFQLSIGFFIKFLVIAGIVIAIFLFLGSQVLQIKKSWQK